MPNPNRMICPHCHQTLAEERVGVRLPPLKAAIFDAIKAAGEPGISSVEVISSVYQGRAKPSRDAIKSHVWQINEALEDTDFIIRSGGGGSNACWCLERR